ncbi:hypothetical protein PHLCEN_2v7109 [Hermanssonia centrifuga]|uniref:Organic hydroperoxide resistance protein n=1 Tax=Hermanssonia centrifuga TaxID=98765 RepID=A0A2R6NXJ5_9APHY|nr:hypothetical protein PHLCEN_2v7109 [Hermanssonia centrifuga]
MRPAQVVFGPLVARVMNGAAGRYTQFPNALHRRNMITLKDHLYFAKATAEGAGRNGIVKSTGDSPLELKLAMPKVAAGKGDGQNPEQLFAMGYSSCFLGALQLAASRADQKEMAENAKITASVFLGHPTDPDMDGFGLRVELNVEGCDDDAIIQAAHDVGSPMHSDNPAHR